MVAMTPAMVQTIDRTTAAGIPNERARSESWPSASAAKPKRVR